MIKLPKARNENILMQSLEKETLLCDTVTGKFYCLNPTSSVVYNYCDGKTSVDELKRKTSLTDDLIFLALEQLKEEKLLEANTEIPNKFAGLTRREVIRRAGLGTMMALPVISALIAPKAAQAASAETCDTACTCSATNPSNELNAICEFIGDGTSTSSGCTTEIPSCRCIVFPNSNTGVCANIAV